MSITVNNGLKSFRPENTEDTLYIEGNWAGVSLRELIAACKNAFPNASFDDIEITAEYIHTECLGYDKYDPGDYTNYIVATNKKATK